MSRQMKYKTKEKPSCSPAKRHTNDTKIIAPRKKARAVTQTAAQTMGKKRRKQCS